MNSENIDTEPLELKTKITKEEEKEENIYSECNIESISRYDINTTASVKVDKAENKVITDLEGKHSVSNMPFCNQDSDICVEPLPALEESVYSEVCHYKNVCLEVSPYENVLPFVSAATRNGNIVSICPHFNTSPLPLEPLTTSEENVCLEVSPYENDLPLVSRPLPSVLGKAEISIISGTKHADDMLRSNSDPSQVISTRKRMVLIQGKRFSRKKILVLVTGLVNCIIIILITSLALANKGWIVKSQIKRNQSSESEKAVSLITDVDNMNSHCDRYTKCLRNITDLKQVTPIEGAKRNNLKKNISKKVVTNNKGKRKTMTFMKIINKSNKALDENNRKWRFWNVNFKTFFESHFEMLLQWNLTMKDKYDFTWSISAVGDEIWVGEDSEIRVYSKDGVLFKTMEMAAVNEPRKILKVSDEDIFIMQELTNVRTEELYNNILIIDKNGKAVETSYPLKTMIYIDYINNIIYGVRVKIEAERQTSILAFTKDKNVKHIKDRWRLYKTYLLKHFKAYDSYVLDFMVNMKLKNHPQFVLLTHFMVNMKLRQYRLELINYDTNNQNITTKKVYDCSGCHKVNLLATNAKMSKLIFWIENNIRQYAVVDSSTNNMHKFDLPKNVNRRLLGIVCDEDGFYWTLSRKKSQITITKYKVS